MRKLLIAASILLSLLFAFAGFAQVINATLSGTVSDTSGALIPGTEITAKHTGTGVASTAVTNEAGAYRFPSLQPGSYEVSATLPGFQPQTFQLTLGTSQQIRQNFVLQVGAVAQAVEVSVAADQLLSAVSSSVGTVLPEKQVLDLPLVGRNVINFATIMPGVVGDGGAGTTFAGIQAGGSGNVNLQLDGVSVNNQRHAQGLYSATVINPDMIEEIRVVVAAVDVEGRGSAQIQARTRSGTNQFHGAAVWNVRNSALNANSWSNNRQRLAPTWYNRHQYTASLGGPIIRNKTFFFALFDGQRGLQKENVDAPVLTDTARQGIFRFFPGVNNGHAEITPSGTGNTRISPVVDLLGNPLDWTRIPGATGPMQSFSVFGDALNQGDPNRRRMDPTGFMARLIQNMPRANAFNAATGSYVTTGTNTNASDGLNVAVHRWTRSTVGGFGGSGASAQDEFNRRQFNLKVDHHFNNNHKLTGSYVHEYRYNNAVALSPWPSGFGGEITTRPQIFMGQFTSTLSSTLLHEFRFSYRQTNLEDKLAFAQSHSNTETSGAAWDFLTQINGIPVIQKPILFPDHVITCPGDLTCSNRGNRSPMYTYTDTLSWTKGPHALKFGAELRYANSFSWSPQNIIPTVFGGAGDVPVQGIDRIPGLLNTSRTLAENLLLTLSGSIGSISERFEIKEPTDTRFLDFRDTYFHETDPRIFGRIRNWHQDEVNFFVKDDWRVTPNLTLNLGVRYDLFRVPYLVSASGQGFTPGLEGGNNALYGYSGRSISDWMSGGGPQKGALTRTILIGRDTDNPKQGIWPSDKNNWAPAIGFAWSPQWFGQDKTTVRGGYQIAYQLPGNSISWIDVDVGNLPGFTAEPTDLGDGTFRDYSNIQLPLSVTQRPFEVIPITQRAQSLSLHEATYTTPYVQTFTLGVTRSLASNLTMDVRYTGTRGVKLHSQGYNLNDADIRNNGLLQALEITRAGGNAEVFDRMLRDLNFGTGIGVVGRDVAGSEALRRHASFRTNIANGNFVAVARLLNTTNIGTVQPAGQITNGGLLRSSGLFPENFIVTNPQFNTITLRTNSDSSIYHSLQTQVTLRPTHGVSYQATYLWSRSLGVTTSGVRDLWNRDADYTRLPSDRTHSFRSYGTFELPFGPGRLFGGNRSGWLARTIEGWKVGTIFNLTSGAPLNVSGQTTLYSAGTPDVVGNFIRDGKVRWPDSGGIFGSFFPDEYQRPTDPSCATIAASLRTFCTNTALADANGNIILRNAAPGQPGTLGLRPIEGPGRWDLDANIHKSIRIQESKSLTFRVDAQNLFNHPTPGNPNVNINSGTFGQITTKTGNRTLQAQVRLDF
jgi:hypothetical protein